MVTHDPFKTVEALQQAAEMAVEGYASQLGRLQEYLERLQ